MDDRGEKIVTLARAVLHSGCPEDVVHHHDTPSNDKPFKALCVTALLAAIGSSAITSWADEQNRPISHYEMVEIDALVFYAARQNFMDETSLRQEVTAALNIPNMKVMNVSEYSEVRDYLRNKIR